MATPLCARPNLGIAAVLLGLTSVAFSLMAMLSGGPTAKAAFVIASVFVGVASIAVGAIGEAYG